MSEESALKQTASVGWSSYHDNIFGALVRAMHTYQTVWDDMQRRCKEGGFDVESVAQFDEVEEAAVPVILIGHAVIEALANWYIGLKSSPERFQEIQKTTSLFRKWTNIPREWLPNYALDSGSELSQDLRGLIDRRKRITHHKSMIEIDGEKLHEGDSKKMEEANPEFIRGIALLPIHLIEHLMTFDDEVYLHSVTVSFIQKESVILNQIHRRAKAAFGKEMNSSS